MSDRYPVFYCDCGRALEPVLARAAAVRCLDCRDVVAGGQPNTAPTPLIVEPPSLAARENAAQQVAA